MDSHLGSNYLKHRMHVPERSLGNESVANAMDEKRNPPNASKLKLHKPNTPKQTILDSPRSGHDDKVGVPLTLRREHHVQVEEKLVDALPAALGGQPLVVKGVVHVGGSTFP